MTQRRLRESSALRAAAGLVGRRDPALAPCKQPESAQAIEQKWRLPPPPRAPRASGPQVNHAGPNAPENFWERKKKGKSGPERQGGKETYRRRKLKKNPPHLHVIPGRWPRPGILSQEKKEANVAAARFLSYRDLPSVVVVVIVLHFILLLNRGIANCPIGLAFCNSGGPRKGGSSSGCAALYCTAPFANGIGVLLLLIWEPREDILCILQCFR